MKKQTKYIFKTFALVSVLTYSWSLNAQHLETLISIGLANNPEIQKFDLQYQIASEKVNEVNALPNTEVVVGYFVSPPETRTGPQVVKVSVKQMIPWFGSVTSRSKYAASLADVQYETIAIAKRKLLSTVSQSYYNMWAIKAKQAVFSQQIALLKNYEKWALTAVEVSKASVVDVLKIQIRQNDVEQLNAVLEQEYLAEQSRLNLLLNRSEKQQINITDTLIMPEVADLNTENMVTALHPELLQYDKLYESVEQSELLNQKERAPMVGFGLDYITVNKRNDMPIDNNGKDIIMPMLSLSIPVFNKGFTSKTKQNELKKLELNADKLAKKNALETVLEQAVNARNSAKISFETATKNLEKAKDAERLLLTAYETETVNFNDVLDIQELQLKFQINNIEAVKNYYTQQNIIKYLSQ
ncbi:TolC family protein [Formosa sp. A9]|uniref:TolC family protein n=1 Tax=Formosa sp. A9 TaxID=3442641 RepID=UPI003EB811A8